MGIASDDDSPPSAVPRRIDVYFEPRHVRERFDDDHRPINRERAARSIEHGDVETNYIDRDGGTWRYRHPVDGCDVVVGAADATEPNRDFVILSAFVDVTDANRAWVSDTWSHDDVNAAALLQYLKPAGKTVHDAGFSPKNIHVTDPVDYHGHRVINKKGYSLAVCVDCGFESNDGREYDRRTCL